MASDMGGSPSDWYHTTTGTLEEVSITYSGNAIVKQRYCTNCGKKCKVEHKFCGHCGTKLEEQT